MTNEEATIERMERAAEPGAVIPAQRRRLLREGAAVIRTLVARVAELEAEKAERLRRWGGDEKSNGGEL